MSPVEWRRRAAFAEVAEALAINTDEVMAVWPVAITGGYRVLYTTHTDEPERAQVHRALLARSYTGLLAVAERERIGPLAAFLAHAEIWHE